MVGARTGSRGSRPTGIRWKTSRGWTRSRFCNKLSEKERKKPFYEIDGKEIRVPDWNGPGYRLPTEAEWEYACQANASTPTRFSFGNDAGELDDYAWFKRNSDSRPHPMGLKKPNGFGLYDMHGNVWEWCWDWQGAGYYNQSPTDDPTGPARGFEPDIPRRELVRPPRDCRSAFGEGSLRAGGGAIWASAWPWVSLAAELRWNAGACVTILSLEWIARGKEVNDVPTT